MDINLQIGTFVKESLLSFPIISDQILSTTIEV